MKMRAGGSLIVASLLGGSSWAQNQVPQPSPDFYCAVDGILTSVDAPGVLANDVDADGDPLSAVLAAAPASGTLTLRVDGSFDYEPPAGLAGTVTFTYRAKDESISSLPTTVEISVGQRVGCTDESNYLSTISNLGYLVVQEGFESDAEWNATRFPKTAASVTSLGVTWAANRTLGKLSTGMGAARVGLWGIFANPHGITTGALNTPQRDGFYVTRSEILYGAGGWIFSNTRGAQIAAELDGSAPISFPDPLLSSLHRFYGVIDTAGFSRLEFFETEGTVEDQKYIFGDDFTFAVFSASGNRSPLATDDLYSATAESELLVGPPGVLNNDTDADGDPLTSVLVDSPQFGVLTLASDGSFVYYPDPGFAGDDRFTYVANDGFVNSNVATVTIAVSGTNQPPIPQADAFTIEEGGTLNVPTQGVLENDFDPDFDVLTAAVATAPSFGDLALSSDGSFTYIHDGSENFVDEFTYIASDGLLSASATVSLFIIPVNDSTPVANGDGYGVTEGGTLALGTPGVLVNDTDADGDPLAAAVASPPAHGILTLASDGSFTYVHDGSENFTDGFTYTASDGVHLSATATVSLAIAPVNDNSPLANEDAFAVDPGETLTVPAPGVLENDVDADSDPLSVSLAAGPSFGTLTLGSDGSFTYVHDGSENFLDGFAYVASDGFHISAPATVSITILSSTPEAPIAYDDRYSVESGGTLDTSVAGGRSVLANDIDPNGDRLSARLGESPHNATFFELYSNGSFIYVHDGTEEIEDWFTYVASDGVFDSSPARVTIAIGPPNRAPIAVTERRRRARVGIAITLDGSDSFDPDGDPITYWWSFRSVPNGRLRQSSMTDTAITGRDTPAPSFVPDVPGSYVLELVVNDGELASAPSFTSVVAVGRVNRTRLDAQPARPSRSGSGDARGTAGSGVLPRARAGSDVHVLLGAYAGVDGSASSDSDGLPELLTYRWSVVSAPPGSGIRTSNLLDSRSARPLFFPDARGIYVLRLEVSDGRSSDFDNVMVIVP